MSRVLMLSPHFPPDGAAAAHRVRLLAPHLGAFGWEPTVVTVDPRDYEGALDHGLADLVPASLRVVRARAWPARVTRRLGVGDLGLRAFAGLRRAAVDLLSRERHDAVFVTIYPTYPALLGPMLKRRFDVPFVLDYQDPWVGEWGRTVGAGPGGRADLKSRLARALGTRLEPRAARAADAITAVSRATYEDVQRRYPELARTPCLALPIGGEASDFARVGPGGARQEPDGAVHICYVGTVLPLGFETLRAVLTAAGRLRRDRPDLYARLRLQFVGTGNQTGPGVAPRVLPLARELGVADCVTETAPRVPYLDALAVQARAAAILLMGSAERHYTASKLYPALLARRPLLAVFHEASSAVDVLRRAGGPPAVRLITYGDAERALSRVDAIAAALAALAADPPHEGAAAPELLDEVSARSLAGRLAGLLDRVRGRA